MNALADIQSRSWKNVDKDGPEIGELSTLAAVKISLLVKEGKSLQEAESEAEIWLAEQNVPSFLVEIAVDEAMAMMSWTWKGKQLKEVLMRYSNP